MMKHSHFALLAPVCALLTGCDILEETKDLVDPPEAAFIGMEVVKAPTARNAAAWACYEWLDDLYCQAAGWDSKPGPQRMRISLDFAFDLSNPNQNLAIPLVEILLGMTVIEDTNLGSVCISFCDPDEAECEVTRNAEGACSLDDATEVTQPEDLVPTVDDMIDLAEDIADGELEDDNFSWRSIPPGESVESHVRFDLSTATVYRLAETLLLDAVEDFIEGDRVSLVVPYTVDGSLFFNVPKMGRYAIGFGPTPEREFSLIE